jgi:type I restriction enzyme R subunit
LIVDYIGVFRNLEDALAIYAAPGADSDEVPVKDKTELMAWMRAAIENARSFCQEHGVDLDGMLAASGFELVAKGQAALEQILVNEETNTEFLAHVHLVDRLFKAILPDPEANEFGPVRAALVYLSEAIAALNRPVDVSHVMTRVEQLLDQSVAANAYVIHSRGDEAAGQIIDLNEVDWDNLAERLAKGNKRTEAEKLKAAVVR